MKRSVKIKQSAKGEIVAPSSKSAAQRAAAIALLSNSPVSIQNMNGSDDIESGINAARFLGSEVKCIDDFTVFSGKMHNTGNIVNVGESGTAFRLFSPIAGLLNEEIVITGNGTLTKRPMDMVVDALHNLGVKCISTNGFLPLKITGPMKKNEVQIDGSISSQLLTGLLIAQGQNTNGFTIYTNNLKSKPYIDLTIAMMREFGVTVENKNYCKFYISPGQNYNLKSYNIEGDWSGASFFIVHAAVNGEIKIKNLRSDSKQADINILKAVKQAGAEIFFDKETLIIKKNKLKPFCFDANDCPDLFPPLVSLALFIKGKSVIKGVNRLKYKESDRAKVLKTEFTKLGGKIEIENDEMIITGGNTTGGVIDSNNDHRIAMAAAICSSAGEIVINGSESVLKSYNNFYQDFTNIGGLVE